MIIINPKKNPKLLETFNNDPYSNIQIKCQNQTLNLSLSYLSIDSEYFDRVNMDCSSVNLSHLPEKPLIKVLRSLYGELLKSQSISQLQELYKIITFLEIADYKDNIVDYIQENQQQLMNQLQLLEFCFSNDILHSQIRYYHFQRKLALLSDSKNYLKLNKISKKTLNNLLIEYYQIHYSSSKDKAQKQQTQQILNSIMENYFGRNQMKPDQYFNLDEIRMNSDLVKLQAIWEKYHHPISYIVSAKEAIKNSQFITGNIHAANASSPNIGFASFSNYSQDIGNNKFASIYGNMASTGNFGNRTTSGFSSYYNNLPQVNEKPSEQGKKPAFMTNSVISTSLSQQMAKRQILIASLQRELQLKSQIVLSLQIEIQNARNQQNIKTGNIVSAKKITSSQGASNSNTLNKGRDKPITCKKNELLDSAQYYDIEQSILQDIKRSKKNLSSPTNVYSGEYDTSMMQPAFDQARKLNNDQQKQVKTMAKLNLRTGNKRIFS